MAFVERTTISELTSRIKLEPSLCDVFVEGSGDASLISWFLRVNGAREVRVNEVDRIHVPSELILDRKLRPGRRGAVITLALELCERFNGRVPQIACIADRDGEDVESFLKCDCVYFTDFACLEMYLFDPRVLGKFLALAVGRTDIDPVPILDALAVVLRQLFAIRQSSLALGLDLEWLSFDRCCELVNEREIVFDLDDYLRRYVNRGGKFSYLRNLQTALQAKSEPTRLDPRMYMNGHDFVDLLAWFLRRTGLRRRTRPEEVKDMLAVALENQWLLEQPLFRGLINRFVLAQRSE